VILNDIVHDLRFSVRVLRESSANGICGFDAYAWLWRDRAGL